MMQHATRFLIAISLLVLLAGCFRNASDSPNDPTQRQVNLADVMEQQSLTPRPTVDVPTATDTLVPIPLEITPTSDKTLIVGGPPAGDDNGDTTNTNVDEATEETAVLATNTPTVSPSPTVPSPTPTITDVPDSEATVQRPGFADTGISPTPLPTLTPTDIVLATPTNVVSNNNPCIYIVQGGDTLLAITEELDISLDDLYAANPIIAANPDALQIGQQIQIPGCVVDDDGAAASITPTIESTTDSETDGGIPTELPVNTDGLQIHIVQSGDNLFRIAQTYGTTVDAIVAANDTLFNENTPIFPGDEIIIPPSE